MSLYDHFNEFERGVLRARASRLANSNQTDTHETDDSALSVTLGGETYALPINALTAIYERTGVTPVPCTPVYVNGIANIRGHIVPVLDLARLLGVTVEDEGDTADESLIIVTTSRMTIAFSVRSIGDVLPYSHNGLAPLPANINEVHARYLHGLLPDSTALINPFAILDDPAIIVTTSNF